MWQWLLVVWSALGPCLPALWPESPLPLGRSAPWAAPAVFSAAYSVWTGPSRTGPLAVSAGRRGSLLVVGLDRDPESPDRDRRSDRHADSLILLTTVFGSGTVDAIHIPRDTRVFWKGRGIKINGLLLSGDRNALSRAVAEVTGFYPDVVAELDFSRFRRAVEIVGGVPFRLSRRILSPEGDAAVGPGRVWLTPAKALAVVRFRHEPLGDIARVHRQERFLRTALELAGNLPWPLFREALLSADPEWPAALAPGVYEALRSMRRYRAHSVPGNFSVGPGASYWIPDQDRMRWIAGVIRGAATAENAVFARPAPPGGEADDDDGRDRSR